MIPRRGRRGGRGRRENAETRRQINRCLIRSDDTTMILGVIAKIENHPTPPLPPLPSTRVIRDSELVWTRRARNYANVHFASESFASSFRVSSPSSLRPVRAQYDREVVAQVGRETDSRDSQGRQGAEQGGRAIVSKLKSCGNIINDAAR